MEITASLGADLASMAARARESIVHVVDGRRGSGTGIVWNRNGMVVTNAHSIRSTPTVVTFDGLTLRTRVLAYDADEDLAVLHVPGLDQPPIRRGDSRRLRAGEFVCAVGNPWGLPGTVTLGTVLGTGSRWRQPALDGKDLIVTDVLPRPGNSGGPLVDTEGRLVGIASMVIAPALGVAIPTHTIAEFARMVDA